MKNNLLKLLLVGSFPVLLFSCKKEDVANKKTPIDPKITEQQAIQRHVVNTMQLQTKMIGALVGSSAGKRMSALNGFGDGCYTTSNKDSIGNMTVDFGSGGCTSGGHTYSGVVVITRNSGSLEDAGSWLNLEFQSLQIDSIVFNGTLLVEGYGTNASGNFYGRITSNLSSGVFGLQRYDISGTQVLDLEVVDPDHNIEDNETYSITGGGSGTNKDGLSFTNTITTALEFLGNGCDYVVKGNLHINTPSAPVQDTYIDYGDGTCDDQILVTENGIPRVESLD